MSSENPSDPSELTPQEHFNNVQITGLEMLKEAGGDICETGMKFSNGRREKINYKYFREIEVTDAGNGQVEIRFIYKDSNDCALFIHPSKPKPVDNKVVHHPPKPSLRSTFRNLINRVLGF